MCGIICNKIWRNVTEVYTQVQLEWWFHIQIPDTVTWNIKVSLENWTSKFQNINAMYIRFFMQNLPSKCLKGNKIFL